MTGKRSDRIFGETEVREILADAIQRDLLRADGLTVEELKTAAAGVGIGEMSLMQAVASFESRQSVAARSVSHLPRLLFKSCAAGGLLAAGTGLIMSSVSGAMPQAYMPMAVLAAFMISGGAAAIKACEGPSMAFLEFQARNLGLWVGFGVGTYFAIRGGSGDLAALLPSIVLGTTAMFWAATSAVGGLVSAWRGRRHCEGVEGPGSSSTHRFSAIKRRVGTKLKQWIDDALMRERLVLGRCSRPMKEAVE